MIFFFVITYDLNVMRSHFIHLLITSRLTFITGETLEEVHEVMKLKRGHSLNTFPLCWCDNNLNVIKRKIDLGVLSLCFCALGFEFGFVYPSSPFLSLFECNVLYLYFVHFYNNRALLHWWKLFVSLCGYTRTHNYGHCWSFHGVCWQ